jgi:hypothetical protein
MVAKKRDVSRGAPGRFYDRQAYQCPVEDVWVTVETPQEERA